MGSMTSVAGLAINDLAELERGFELSLRARNRSPKTIKSCMEALRLFRDYLVRVGMPTQLDRITREALVVHRRPT